MEKTFPRPPRRNHGFVASVLHAFRGLVHTVVSQPNMRIHVIAAVLVGLVGSGIPLGLAEKVTLIFCVILIFFAEILNSALEALVDLAVEQMHEKAKVSKDAAAAGVLVLAMGTVVIFAAILVHNAPTIFSHLDEIRRQIYWGAPLASCLAIWLAVGNRSIAIEMALAMTTLALWAVLLTFSVSYVFSAMLLGLWALVWTSAREIRLAKSQRSAQAE